MNKLITLFKESGPAIYVLIATLVSTLISIILFAVGFQTGYHSWGSLVCFILLIVADLVLFLFKKEAFIGAVSTILSALAIGFFIYEAYNYVAVVMTGVDIESFSPDFIASCIFFILNYALSVAMIFVPFKKKEALKPQVESN